MILPRAIALALAAASYLTSTIAVAANDPEIESAARDYLARQAHLWMDSPLIVESVSVQNQSSAGLSQQAINQLDLKWRQEAESGGGLMIDRVMANALSVYLLSVQRNANGLITEIFVMDDKGMNVGQSSVTSDFWQGDEGKWRRSYLQGAGATFVDEVSFDESSQRFQVQLSVPVVNPENGQAIGAMTIGMDAEGLLML